MLAILVLLSVIVAQRVFTYNYYLSANAQTGCVHMDTSGAAVSLDMSTNSCGNSDQKCPGCFVITASGYQLTVSNCHYMPVTGATSTSHVRVLTFANMGSTQQSIHDGTSVVRILEAIGTSGGGSMTQCMCVAGRLACS